MGINRPIKKVNRKTCRSNPRICKTLPEPKYWETRAEVAISVCRKTQIRAERKAPTTPTAARDAALFCGKFPTTAASVKASIGSTTPASIAGMARRWISLRETFARDKALFWAKLAIFNHSRYGWVKTAAGVKNIRFSWV